MVKWHKFQKIDWKLRDSEISPERFKHLKEYLRRAAICAHKLGCPDAWPFGNFAIAIEPDSKLSEAQVEFISKLPISTREKILIENAFQWWNLDSQKLEVLDGLDIFAPLLGLFQAGGILYTENRMLIFDGASIPYGKIKDYLEMKPHVDLT